MNKISPQGPPPPRASEGAPRRLAEAALLAEANASLAAGEFITEAEVDAWVASIGTSDELPMPTVRL